MNDSCVLCLGAAGDPQFERVQVWEDRLWRLTTVTGGEVLGFSYLEPKRHIPHITDLDGEEAERLGGVLARTTSALRAAAKSQLVYVYVFGGGISHLHFHLAPHSSGDALNDRMIRGEVVETHLPNGGTAIASREFPSLPASKHQEILARIRLALNA